MNGLEIGRRRQDACTAEGNGNSQHLGLRLFRREFIGDSPAGNLDGVSQPFLLGKGVNLDDHAVRRVGQGIALFIPAVDIGDDFFHSLAFAVFRIDLEAKGL